MLNQDGGQLAQLRVIQTKPALQRRAGDVKRLKISHVDPARSSPGIVALKGPIRLRSGHPQYNELAFFRPAEPDELCPC